MSRSPTDTAHGAPINPALFAELMEAARRAPSPDNNQPWSFQQAGDAIRVLHVRERAVSSDCHDLFSWLAVGSTIENITLRASTHRLVAEVTYQARPFPTVGHHEHVADIRLRSAQVEIDPLAAHLKSRCTNRKPYARRALDAETLQQIERAVGMDNVGVRWLTDRAEIKRMAGLVAAADRIRFEHQPFHEELHSVLRFTPEQVEHTRDGLDVRTLELPGLVVPFLRWLGPWPRMRRLNRMGLSRAFAAMSALQVRASGALAMFSTTEMTDAGYLEAGRAMQRFWLAATAEGLATQPLGALPLFLLTLKSDPNKFRPHHADAMRVLSGSLGDEASGQPIMLFRLGSAKSPSGRSIRYQSVEADAIS